MFVSAAIAAGYGKNSFLISALVLLPPALWGPLTKPQQ